MDNIETKLEKYRKNITHNEVLMAFKVFYETKDSKIRENLIYRYMLNAKKIALGFKEINIDEEDLIQIAYETLIKCIDNYNPYANTPFNNYLYPSIRNNIKRQNKKEEVSLSDLEIISNTNLEDKIIDNIYKKYLINLIKWYLDRENRPKYMNIFSKIYGIDCEVQKTKEIIESENVYIHYIPNAKRKMLIKLYVFLARYAKHYPSDTVEKCIRELSFSDSDKMEYLTFYRDYDSLENSHRILKDSTEKKINYKMLYIYLNQMCVAG